MMNLMINVKLLKLKKWSLKDDDFFNFRNSKGILVISENYVQLFWSIRKSHPHVSARRIISTIVKLKDYAMQNKRQ
jgi:hypothetical protein